MSEPFIDYRTHIVRCPGCGAGMDGHLATRPGQSPPDDGSVAICAECSQISIFVMIMGHLALREPTRAELDDVLRDEHVQEIITGMRMLREQDRG